MYYLSTACHPFCFLDVPLLCLLMSRLLSSKHLPVALIALLMTLVVPFVIYHKVQTADENKSQFVFTQQAVAPPKHFQIYEPQQLRQWKPKLTASLNTFALDILREMRRGGQTHNLIFSPLSIHSAFSMVCAGANDKTLTQCQQVLHWSQDSMLLLHQLYHQLIADFTQGELQIRVGNQLFTQPSLRLLESYMQTIKWAYYGNHMNVDFSNAKKAVGIINDWISQVTSKQITRLVQEEDMQPGLMMILASALHMNVLWLWPFDQRSTHQRPFFLGQDKQVMVDMMSAKNMYGYKHVNGVTAVTLPLQGSKFEFLIVMPDEIDGLAALESTLTLESFRQYQFLPPADLTINLPKFKGKSDSIDLVPIMKALGLKDAFLRSANFKGITDAAELFIDRAKHDAIIEVDERGVKASAVTRVYMLVTAGRHSFESIPLVVTIDRPFLFAIQHVNTGELLFLGRQTGRS